MNEDKKTAEEILLLKKMQEMTDSKVADLKKSDDDAKKRSVPVAKTEPEKKEEAPVDLQKIYDSITKLDDQISIMKMDLNEYTKVNELIWNMLSQQESKISVMFADTGKIRESISIINLRLSVLNDSISSVSESIKSIYSGMSGISSKIDTVNGSVIAIDAKSTVINQTLESAKKDTETLKTFAENTDNKVNNIAETTEQLEVEEPPNVR